MEQAPTSTIDTGIASLPKIISDVKALKVQCEPVATKEEGEEIAKILFQVLNETKGAGLSAPQIGINKRVFVVNTRKPLYFINPQIDNQEGSIAYVEGCLSFPTFYVRTRRFSSFKITDWNNEGGLLYDVSEVPQEGILENQEVFEMVAIQHEYDHLSGILMFDREFKGEPVKVEKTIGRNDWVNITDGKDTFKVKYKKAEENIRRQKWFIVEEKR